MGLSKNSRVWVCGMAVTLTLPKCPQPMVLLNANGLKNKAMFIIRNGQYEVNFAFFL